MDWQVHCTLTIDQEIRLSLSLCPHTPPLPPPTINFFLPSICRLRAQKHISIHIHKNIHLYFHEYTAYPRTHARMYAHITLCARNFTAHGKRNSPPQSDTHVSQAFATHRNTLQHTATRCNTLQHTASHCNTSRRPLQPSVSISQS